MPVHLPQPFNHVCANLLVEVAKILRKTPKKEKKCDKSYVGNDDAYLTSFNKFLYIFVYILTQNITILTNQPFNHVCANFLVEVAKILRKMPKIEKL